ncbi:MAG: synthase subcomplex delta subunit [Cyanobacteria bacterium RYN_339]|nr:synthase subcomplex delta subunit [Cyanobacteria bacterium RYN_339]
MIADRYADAIFQAALPQGADTLQTIDGNLADVAAMFKDNADLARLWKHPVVKRADKQALVRQLFGGKIHPLALNLLLLLVDKKRGVIFGQVQQAFRTRYNALRQRATIKVTSALPLDAAQVESLRHEFATKLSKEVQVDTAVDPALIGGVVVQIEDQVIDGSIRGRLEALRMSLN